MKRPDHGSSPSLNLKRKVFRTTLAAVRQFDEVGIVKSGKPLRQTVFLLKNFLNRPGNKLFGTVCFYGSKFAFFFRRCVGNFLCTAIEPCFSPPGSFGPHEGQSKIASAGRTHVVNHY